VKLSERLRKDAEHIWKKIYVHPFVKELFKGTLPEQKFRFYILQDYNYLISSIKNFSILAARAKNENAMRKLIDIAYTEAKGEFEGYQNFLRKMKLTIAEAENQKQLQAGTSYISFLLATSSLQSFEEGITATLPCYWSYAEIAKFNKKELVENKNELYKEWAYYYLGNDYLNLVDKIKNSVDEIGSDFPYDRLKLVFITSSQYEYMFWDSVYNEKV